MDDRKRTLAAITVLVGILVLAIVIIGVVVSARRVVSPVPEDDAIKIIFITPTIAPAVTVEPIPTEAEVTPTKKPTLRPTPTSKPTSGATPSVTPTP